MSTLSVIIPCFNNGKFLKEMMDCCLRQTFVDWELIIVDDQSTDNTTHQLIQEYVLRDNRIKFYVRDRLPKGSVVCRNIGFDKSCGKYIIHFDADDLIPETCFERRVCFMEENPDCDYATFPTGAFYDGEPLPVWNGQAYKGVKLDNPDLLSCFLSNNYPFSCWCNIYKRSSIESLQWDEEVLIYTDFSFIVPCILAGLKHKFCDLGNYDYFYRKFKTGKNMCSSFVSDEKCYSTNRLFRLTIEEIKKLFYKGSLGNQIFLKSQKAFKQIEWKDAWQVYKDESDVTADFHARREVNQFLSARNRAILLEGFEVPGITVRTAMGKFLLYHQEGDFYE